MAEELVCGTLSHHTVTLKSLKLRRTFMLVLEYRCAPVVIGGVLILRTMLITKSNTEKTD